jgi:hypothetical protein
MAKTMGTERSKIRHQRLVTYKAFLIACSDAAKIFEVVVSSDNVNRLLLEIKQTIGEQIR